MTTDDIYVPIAIQLLYGDLVTSASSEKRAQAAELLQQYPQLATPSKTAPANFSSRINTAAWELSFEATRLVPILDTAQLQYKHQYIVPIRVGRSFHQGRIDFYLHDEVGILSIIESKRSITDTNELSEAFAQAKSYALPLGTPSFLVAAPQGVWLYTLYRNQETLQHHYTIPAFQKGIRQLPALLRSYR